jgi:Zn-dependent protease with chaperone function
MFHAALYRVTSVSRCSVCKAQGGCPSCRGAGSVNGKRCLICRGSGSCPVCGLPFDPTAVPSPIEPPAAAVRVRTAVAATAELVSSVEVPVTVTRWTNAKLTSRAVLALLVLVAFYAFTLCTIAFLLLITWLEVQLFSQPRSGGVILIGLIIPPLGAVAIFLAIMPRGPRLGYPGRGLSPKRAPELFDVLRQVARQARQKMPRAVYLFSEPNAFVGNRGLFLGRAMGLGLPLFDVLTVDELRAIVAHEFGHHANRAGPITTMVYRATRTFGAATAAAGVVPFLDGVFEIWTEVFLRLAMPISRQYELRCDELACRITGVDTTIRALTKISRLGDIAEIASPVADWEEDLHSTHPPLRDRIAMARALDLPAPAAPGDDRPASVLIQGLRVPVDAA